MIIFLAPLPSFPACCPLVIVHHCLMFMNGAAGRTFQQHLQPAGDVLNSNHNSHTCNNLDRNYR